MQTPKVYLGIPTYGEMVNAGLIEAVIMATRNGYLQRMQAMSFSILTKTFNMLYTAALNARAEGVTHFCMLHADVVPENFWLDKMVSLMQTNGASVLSVVIPIKDNRGLTSTALDESISGRDPEWQPRRLTLREIYKRPATFSTANLLINTGLMLVDITKPWAEHVRFQFRDRIVKRDGKFVADVIPEDWDFSRQVSGYGGTIWATREVRVNHLGHAKFQNDKAWGALETDA